MCSIHAPLKNSCRCCGDSDPHLNTLFSLSVDPEEIPAIPGLSYRPIYTDLDAETRLVEAIDQELWDTSWERRRQLYGFGYGRKEGLERDIPNWARPLIDRLHRDGIGERPFDQMLVNEYLPGQGIAMHLDHKPFDRTVVSLSLLSACVMDFRRLSDGHRESLLLEQRSLLVLSDAARYEWQHGIARRQNDRWRGIKLPRGRRLSVTFRLFKR
jgi:alkylated DNA repair dioxygenase AlkB